MARALYPPPEDPASVSDADRVSSLDHVHDPRDDAGLPKRWAEDERSIVHQVQVSLVYAISGEEMEALRKA